MRRIDSTTEMKEGVNTQMSALSEIDTIQPYKHNNISMDRSNIIKR